ncbi:RBBP9/YdeN family alpha/beta hydrolase [Fodinibius salsisoli]|uniref:Serine hydrolase family protein n=1 Tax=Fodinibius salsisoli TaxID=2820877 RepID=A0ABT3PK16_9BACT|nr:alpha/beta hydrolase [Fodinibius salsisoli]MCW9706280.1 serine hydrolase family protein [Fodinibius salsisoli]
MITRQILFIQGGGEGAYEEDRLLAESLRDKLGAACDVRYPRMPEEEGSTYEEWKERLTKEFAALDREVILVAHSVGGSLLFKYLTEEEMKASILGLFLVAAPYFGAKNWEFDDFALPNGFASKLPKNLPVFFYHSRDDQWVSFKHLSLYAKKLPQASIREFNDRGHQFNNDLSEVARDIKGLMD